MRQLLLSLAFLFFLPGLVWPQTGGQNLRGTIKDADTGQPLIGASIYLPDLGQGATTDSLGRYRLDSLMPGRYEVEASFIGCESLEIPEILITSGKERVLDIALRETITDLDAVVVRAARALTESISPTLQLLTQEETLRFPATFYDPARLATSYAGVVATNDQANHLSIRGQSPNGNKWRLEGLEIINPNHTANAGTFTDRSTVSGGGVNAMSAQLLDNTLFYRGAMPTTYGNATAAIIDMRLRRGNNEQREYTLQAGLIGVDLAAEGPFRAGGASYLINYRYSFTGLLSDLGVPLGDEDIRFQDLSFHLAFPQVFGGDFSVFGLLGKSSNEFVGPSDPAEREEEKDLYDYINYNARQATAGFRWTKPNGRRGQWRLLGAWSGMEGKREAEAEDLFPFPKQLSRVQQEKASVIAGYRWKGGPAASWDGGVEALYQTNRILSRFTQDIETPLTENSGYVLQPFVRWSGRKARWAWELGLRASYYGDWLDNAIYSEPRLLISWFSQPQSKWSFSYGLHSQAPSPYNESPIPMRAHHLNLEWSKQFNPRLQLSIQSYYQYVFQAYRDGEVSAIDGMEDLFLSYQAGSIVRTTEGRNLGLELSLQRFAGAGWWYLLSGTIYDSKYRNIEEEWVDSRFNGRYAASLTLGREINGTDRKGQARTLGFNLAARFNGGLRQAPIVDVLSRQNQTTVFDFSQGFTDQLPDYFRVDLRIYYTRNFAKSSSTLSLDIQNVTGQQNTAYMYYDRFLEAVTTRYQLEFIPILSYRLSF